MHGAIARAQRTAVEGEHPAQDVERHDKEIRSRAVRFVEAGQPVV